MFYGYLQSKTRYPFLHLSRAIYSWNSLNLCLNDTFLTLQNTVSGTDVKDSKEVKTEYGMMKDFQDLILAAQAIGNFFSFEGENLHEKFSKIFLFVVQQSGMKVIMDLVMNHSGTSHTWFKQSLLLTPPFKDYYVWSRGKNSMNPAAGTNQPPNNWVKLLFHLLFVALHFIWFSPDLNSWRIGLAMEWS